MLGHCNKMSAVVTAGVLVGSPSAVIDGSFGKGVGPIFLDKLRCRTGDNNLLDCQSGEPHGLVTCSHAQDVGVRCPGINCQLVKE